MDDYSRISADANSSIAYTTDVHNFIGDTTDGFIYRRASTDKKNYRFNDMRETTDCISGMGAKDGTDYFPNRRISTGNFTGTTENIRREVPLGLISEENLETCVGFRPITQSESSGDDRSETVTYDCLGVSEDENDRYERLHLREATADSHIYTGHITPVMRDILAEMPPGMTAEDVLRTCADDRPTANESDDEDPEENSYYVEGVIPDITGSGTGNEE